MTEGIIEGNRIPGMIQAARIQPGTVLQNQAELIKSGLILWAFLKNCQDSINNLVRHLTSELSGL